MTANPESGRNRLILCFDGTWNTPEDHTNVFRLYAAIPDRSSGCPDQLKFYDEGVGTSLGTKISGGAFGLGLDENMLKGYCWLIQHYQPGLGRPKLVELPATVISEPPGPPVVEPGPQSFEDGDQIFAFGFSRGAFTARSLSGMINRCGILRLDGFATPAAVTTDHPLIRQAWNLYRKTLDGAQADGRKIPTRNLAECEAFRQQHAWVPKVRFVGVWDTVGALGVPAFNGTNLPFSPARFRFHDTSLGRVIDNGYHACAIDENRPDFAVTLWSAKSHPGQQVEQRWFPGAHANVGGGYEDDTLPDPPMKWLAERAIACGMEFRKDFLGTDPNRCAMALPRDFELMGNEYLAPVRDSYKEFAYGLYAPLSDLKALLGGGHFDGRLYRPMLIYGINEVIDDSATLKLSRDSDYHPPNLAHAGRDDLNAAEIRRLDNPAATYGEGE